MQLYLLTATNTNRQDVIVGALIAAYSMEKAMQLVEDYVARSSMDYDRTVAIIQRVGVAGMQYNNEVIQVFHQYG